MDAIVTVKDDSAKSLTYCKKEEIEEARERRRVAGSFNRCDSCDYVYVNGNDDYTCALHPPNTKGNFPKVKEDCQCGQYKPDPALKATCYHCSAFCFLEDTGPVDHRRGECLALPPTAEGWPKVNAHDCCDSWRRSWH